MTTIKDAVFHEINKSDIKELHISKQTQWQMEVYQSRPANNWRKEKETALMNNN